MYNELKPYHTSIDNIHKLGFWHQTFACWLVNKDENVIYLQLRGPKIELAQILLMPQQAGI